MREPVRILSDLHLGHRVSRIARVASLRPLLADAGTVVFNGDTWQELSAPFRERSAEMLEELREMCRQEGADAVFQSGNHDPGWPGKGWLELAAGKILVTHGDALYFDGSPWSREAMAGQRLVAALWAEHRAAGHDACERLALAREIARTLEPRRFPQGSSLWSRAWQAAFPPGRALRMIDVWTGQATAGALFCEHYFPAAEVLVIGHFHWPGAWLRRHKLVLNTGGWMNPCSAWCVEWNHGFLRRIKVIENTSTGCRLGTTTETWRLAGA